MSLAEIKEELKTMSREERLTLAEHLQVLNRIDDPEVQGEVNAAMARMDAGHRISRSEFERLLADEHSTAP